jgi:hypothetical protein
MAESISKSHFPSQTLSDVEKASPKFGLEVARAIENEWFKRDSSGNRFYINQNSFHKLRLYARGEQSVQKYKDELSINGDLSYLNLDWKPVPIIPKFVDIVVNGMANRSYDIKAYSQDPFGVEKRTQYMESVLRDMEAKELDAFIQQEFGVRTQESSLQELPGSQEELDLHMQLNYKEAIEIAEEQALSVTFEKNRYELIRKRFYYDLAVLGIGTVKTTYTNSEGIKVEYVDPTNLVYSYTESPYFEDIYYIGEVKTIPINELKKDFPDLSNEELEKLTSGTFSNYRSFNKFNPNANKEDKNTVDVLYFNYKTFHNEVYKIKNTVTGASKAIVKDEAFNPPADPRARFERIARNIEVLYEGVYVPGANILLKWQLCENMLRPKSDSAKVRMNYSVVAPRMYNGRIESLVSRITSFADMIQITHLKLQQVMSRMVPDGVYLDADGLAEIDLGNGTNYSPQEALNMFFQTGSVIGRSFTSDGDMNPGKVPIQEINSNSGSNKIASLVSTYNYYLQMMRDATGLNEARDGTSPDPKALVGVQKLAAANSNTATRHILQSGLFLTAETAEKISLRIADVIEYSPAKEAFIQSIGIHNVATLSELTELHLHDFGIFIDLMPDEEEAQKLENNIQAALSGGLIDLEDAIDLREIKNIQLANQMLKVRRKKKLENDQRMQQQNIQAQSQANAQAQQMAAQAEVQKQQALTAQKAELKQLESQLEMQRLANEAKLKKDLMQLEFQMNMQLKGIEVEKAKSAIKEKEDRKDERTKIQASQQSELINQRKNNLPPKVFESAGNDILSGDFDLGSFEPK